MKILFVEPVMVPRVRKLSHKIIRKMYTSNSLTFQMLAAVTPEKHIIKLIDERFDDINYDENCDIVGITCTTFYALHAYEIADEFRKHGKTVILGGHHPSVMPEEAKQHADAVVIGEAEDTWPQLLKDFENGTLKPFYRPTKPVDLKSIPFARRDVVVKNLLVARIQATRGCPHNCNFCCISSIEGTKLRKRPIDNVIEEIKSIPQKFLIFCDASLTSDTEYTKELFKRMKGLKKKFSCCGNADVLGSNSGLLILAKKAGCIAWHIGFENFNQQTLDRIGKKTNIVEKYKDVVEKIHKNKMAVIGSFIIGFDEETKDSLSKYSKQIEKLELDTVELNILTPFPGTSLYLEMEKDGRIFTKDWFRYSEGSRRDDIVFQPKNMTVEDLTKFINEIFMYHIASRQALAINIKQIIKGIKLGFYPWIWSTLHRSLWV